MEMKHLLFFKYAAEMEHITRAAEELMVAQPFLSKTIAALESELGVSLFDHVGRQIRLNEYGKAFYTHVQAIFSEIDNAKRELDDLADRREHSLSLVTNLSLYMPSLSAHLRRQLPVRHLHQESARRPVILQQLRSGEADFAICTPPIYEDSELETMILIAETCPVIYPAGHWLEQCKTPVNLQELAGEDFISAVPGYGIRDVSENFFAAAEIHPNIIIESADTSNIPKYVKKGLGIAFIPLSSLLEEDRTGINYAEIASPSCVIEVGLTWKKNRYQSQVCRDFVNLALQYFSSISPGSLPI